jgi:uncharacterized protein
MNNIYDIIVIGCGVAGVFALHKLSVEQKNLKIIAFDIGRAPRKRRAQTFGWLGVLPNSDGKLFLNNINDVANITSTRAAKKAYNYFIKTLSQVNDFNIIKDNSPNKLLTSKIKKLGYELTTNNYMQMYPADIHALSKRMAADIELNKNITFSFDNEVLDIRKTKNHFVLQTELGEEYHCKKLIIAAGRSGWRWANDLYSKFDIIESNDVAKFGLRIELSAALLKNFNKSNCIITNSELEIGPFSWNGSVIPEDHTDMAISAFRGNENRWKTDKVSFNLIGNRSFPGTGFEQTDRIGKLIFLLSNDRIIKERVSLIMANKSKLSIIPEYDWIKDAIINVSNFIPEILNKGYAHFPTILPMASKINLGTNLESEIAGMFIVGESAGCTGILSAGLTGLIAAGSVLK